MSNAPEKDLASLEQQLAAPDLQNTYAKKQGSTSVLKSKKTETKKNERAPKPQKSVEDNSKQQGKFVELPGAEMGKVVVRFPPEASGYLHIGHAKAALLNQHYQLAFNGRLIMRFDDTNPAKEKEDFEKVILEDVNMLKIKPDTFTYTSDHFDKMLDICENGMLKEGLAYVDDTDGDKIRLEREQRIDSINRNNSIEKNLELWKQMVLGTEIGLKCCVRAKIDMQSANGCLRDPTIYRCKPEHHPRTGDKYKVYPTYDFACPIVDSFEGVTHCLRTTEYTDRDAQYYWFCDALKLGTRSNETRPYVWSYSRLNMTNTVLSKRKLTWFVEQGHVDGWDDPRMPTVRGVFRRGMQVEALKQFIVAQGSSRTVTAMQWDKIWSLNRSIVDSIAPRHTALLLSNSNKENVALSYPPVEVVVENVEKPYKIDNVPKHPKNSQLGLKNCVWAAPKILIDYSDAELLEAGRRATFINWGNLLINRIERNQNNNKIERIHAVSDLENTDFKSTVKVTWLPKTDYSESEEVLPILVPVVCVYFDHLISKAVLAKDDDFKQYLNTENSRWELQMIGDSELKDLKKGDVIQLQRRGYFICDSTYQPYSIHTGKETPLVLFNIPDGHTKSATPITTVPLPITTSNIKKNTNKNIDTVISQINDQANKIHVMTADLEEAGKVLHALKAEYKSIAGVDFPSGGIPTPQLVSNTNLDQSKPSVDAIVVKINEQGDKVRSMKNSKASKADIGEAVKVLLALKAEYKSIAGVDFPSGGIPTPQLVSNTNSDQNKPSVDAIVVKINEQGDKVRSMKNSKASKADIGEAVKVLLSLKAEYKSIAGVDFPSGGIPTPQLVSNTNSDQNKPSVDAIVVKINQQGDKVRSMKNSKASKADIGEAVKVLLALKAEYKSIAGVDFPSGGIPTPQLVSNTNLDQSKPSVDAIVVKINEQGDKVRSMKNSKASKADIGEAVKVLLALKAEYKSIAGVDFPAGGIPTPQLVSNADSDQSKPSVDAIVVKINEQGDKVRSMKNSKASKADIGEAVKVLLALKAEYKSIAGVDFPAGGIPTPQADNSNSELSKPSSADAVVRHINEQCEKTMLTKNSNTSKDKKSKKKENIAVATTKTSDSTNTKKVTKLGLEVLKVSENLGEWYSQVLVKGEMIEYYDVSGCYVLRPWAYRIWELIQEWFDARIKRKPLNVRNCYFPMFVSQGALEREKEHIADFAPEVAWVTKSGETDLAEPIAIRPTSETGMYPAFAKWIQSYRDLPLKLNQWNSVVRWEFKHPQPFLRTREFLWQEGHNAYATREEAERDVLITLGYYEYVYKNMLAVPVIKGKKTEKEKFAGGIFTTTCEAYVASSGRAIQGATSHYLGTNFAKMFDVHFEHPDTHEKSFVHQISFGMTTRTIGVMVMVHGDDRGLVLPPRIASIQVIIVPCGVGVSTANEVKDNLTRTCLDVCNRLKGDSLIETDDENDNNVIQHRNSSLMIRADTDLRDNYSPGWKFNHWELKGVPLRLEIGPKDLDRNQMVAVRRDNGDKLTIPLEGRPNDGGNDKMVVRITELLNQIQQDMYNKAEQEMKENVVICRKWSECAAQLAAKRLLLIPFCGRPICEDNIKRDTTLDDGTADVGASTMGAKSLCVPFEQPKGSDILKSNDQCIHPECGQPAGSFTLFGRSY
ncbi:bifunctional glutamate/proline--tRNA ligase-like isoform X2 [Metopolophium dirhodum]|uniref:bifunctional glutamate/proline--tRNA ligase-like isoform X2 n=1 Tax=Metopolophium dirhodum TaxID=44670 RepID=UPI00299072A4|nr:bifunctional glutamate/proline--tRNA ligase-like isoform X2 [Metopolophium dirhodum]